MMRFQQRLQEKAADPAARPVLYVALGDSVTQGCMEQLTRRNGEDYPHIDHEGVYHEVFRRWVLERFPETIFCVINAGVGGQTATAGLSPVGLGGRKRDAT